MPRPIHFEIPVNDPEKAIAFYGSVFGWTFTRWGAEEYWLVSTGPKEEPGIDGGLLRKRAPDHPQVNTVSVANLGDSMKAVEAAGGTIAVPKMPIAGVGWLAYGRDLDGNIFGMMQTDPDAK
jgi:predicted enzyme related to lactoylglutathione lyase